MALRGSWATSQVWVVGKGRGGRTPRPTRESGQPGGGRTLSGDQLSAPSEAACLLLRPLAVCMACGAASRQWGALPRGTVPSWPQETLGRTVPSHSPRTPGFADRDGSDKNRSYSSRECPTDTGGPQSSAQVAQLLVLPQLRGEGPSPSPSAEPPGPVGWDSGDVGGWPTPGPTGTMLVHTGQSCRAGA